MSKSLDICPNCLKNEKEENLKPILAQKHAKARSQFKLPPKIPKSLEGIKCTICEANCVLSEEEWGWCGLRKNENGKFVNLTNPRKGLLSFYLDPHVTNCCNAWFCPAGTGCGYPHYATRESAEIGNSNLALFFYGCSFNCLFCQNWQHKYISNAQLIESETLINLTLKNEKISCWCWFGGSTEPQFPFALHTSRKMLEMTPKNRVLRICFEWNGCGNPKLVDRTGKIVYESGGNIKFDFKAFTPLLHQALTNRSNKEVKSNIQLIYNNYEKNNSRNVPMLGITTLLVPYYIDSMEVEKIAHYISKIDPNIPLSLLIFHPSFQMQDLPITPVDQVKESYYEAKKHLENVKIGNLHLIGYRKLTDLIS
ncbi:MAG: radical SAM protein [Candidatus Hodarchaeales archaeon]